MHQQLLEQLQNVFRKVFEDEKLNIQPLTSTNDIKMWDSLTHLELIVSVENEFNIKFSFNEVMQFNNVGDMLKIIVKKVNSYMPNEF
ncbi:MAG: acyl carrier protein [Bacteroidetes bacterium CG23_combo_of_CG06-09_8_20_14_all_32_9]|nr:MAG: acyl carrier protein [Bacteroidetes bacterium CG23_combo_of_CG06-09_8_20_14_all_32_9]